ncbi:MULTISPECIES: hypothetical protein [Azospirillum]|nr:MULTISPECIES: hypothetical protein [Azospirillum]MDW7554587.1 hypothetical protein [Azospirillum brasilense]MDW7593894.1 hypothetical protein [Azospirillum brasilense]MDW7632317.1 hypothetical protein [Azospirillum brasilense]MDX5950136.1 hypothetical protein [Azospirillum brasilense]OPH13227.1 hypothetical protein FE89_23045 [Azospirillum brasilense]
MTMLVEKKSGAIDVRLSHLSQLFESVDPSPFCEGRLTSGAEEYFLRRVKEQPLDQPVRIVIHLPAKEMTRSPPFDVAAALTEHFAACAAGESKRIREAIRTWRQAALIGFVVLSICLFLAWHISNNLPPRPMTRILQESFVILGWVSVWKPIETFLYELLPPGRQRRQHLLLRLSSAEVVVSGAPIPGRTCG